jgi:hypothetical protein
VSVIDLLRDVGLDEYQERRKLLLEYYRACEASTQARIQIDTWERRERQAKAERRKVVEEFEARGWMLP